MIWIGLGIGIVLLVLLGYWQLVIAEGAYLGSRAVTLMYDWSARAYERIKQYDSGDEQWFLGLPLSRSLELIPHPLVLDVATGTGRLQRALLRQPGFEGHVIGLDLSRHMLNEAVHRTAQFTDRLTFIWQDAQTIPFDDDTFDAVVCLEALEFTPRPKAVLGELVRVLRPGGVLLTTNRVGRDARWLPGKAFPRGTFATLLESYPLEDVRVRPWQMDYDLAWAAKRGNPAGGGVRPLSSILRCPTCRGPMQHTDALFICCQCLRRYPIGEDGVIEMEEARRRSPRAGRTAAVQGERS